MKEANPFYKSAKWERVRARILRRDKYQCQESRRYGKLRQATTVHHIFPLTDYPEYAFEPWNLISLCAEAHNAMHDRTTGGLSEAGKELLWRTATKRGIECDSGI